MIWPTCKTSLVFSSKTLFFACLAVTFSSHVEAGIIFSENFDGIDVSGGPVDITTSNTSFDLVAHGTDDTAKATDAGDLFGTGNVYMDFREEPLGGGNQYTGTGNIAGLGGGGVAQLSFLFYLPSSDPINSGPGIAVYLYNGTNTGTGNQRTANAHFHDYVEDGTDDPATASMTFFSTEGAYDVILQRDQLYEIALVANYALDDESHTTTVSYASGAHEVIGEHFDVWLDGVLVAEDVPFRSYIDENHIDDADRFIVRGNSGADSNGTLYIDNIVLRDDITIPEPYSIVLFVLGSLCGIICHNRRQ